MFAMQIFDHQILAIQPIFDVYGIQYPLRNYQ
jgi:hypothetical protein